MARKQCEYGKCKKWFTPTRHWQKFHHPDCRMAAFVEKQKPQKQAKAS